MISLSNTFKLTLSRRFVFVTLALLLVIQPASFIAARIAVKEQIASDVAQALNVSARIWQQLLAQSQDRLRQGASVLAADFGFRSAVLSGDEATIGSALLNSAERIQASVAFLITPSNTLKASSVSLTEELKKQYLGILEDIGEASVTDPSTPAGLISLYNGKPTQFVKVPIKAPRVIGYVLMGFTLTQDRVNELKRLSGSDVVIWTEDKRSGQSSSLTTLAVNAEEIQQIPLGQREYVIAQEEFLILHQDVEFSGGSLHLFLFRSLDAAQSAFSKLQIGLGVITLIGIVLFGFGINWASRKVTQPLVALTEATAALGQGNFDVHIDSSGRRDEIGALANSFAQMRRDIQAERQKVLYLAYFDQLTGLPNRLKFIDLIKQGLNGEHDMETPIIVLTINLDRFKQVNDVLGYSIGDQLLNETAKRIKTEIRRAGDKLARVGGDEFAVVLTRTDLPGAWLMARRIQQILRLPVELDGTQIDLSASIGIAMESEDHADADTLVNASQLAMYAAKARSEEIVEYSPTLETSAPENLNLLTELRRAVKNNELRLFLQPKVETQTGRVVAAEALIRWQHPENGMIAPYKFVPFAEQTGFVRELTRWMLDHAASIWQELQPKDHTFRISVNLSTRDLLDPHLPDYLDKLVAKYNIAPPALCLEITESAIMDDPKLAEETLNLLSSRGYRLSIDDFGTGYSSLGYLKRLPVDELKVDQSFVFGMVENENDAIIVRSTIDLAHNLGLDVVAEGVETQAMYDTLKALGCEEAQGYYIGRPMPIEEFKVWRERWESGLGNETS